MAAGILSDMSNYIHGRCSKPHLVGPLDRQVMRKLGIRARKPGSTSSEPLLDQMGRYTFHLILSSKETGWTRMWDVRKRQKAAQRGLSEHALHRGLLTIFNIDRRLKGDIPSLHNLLRPSTTSRANLFFRIPRLFLISFDSYFVILPTYFLLFNKSLTKSFD